MRRVGNACGVVLEAVHVAQFRADAVRQHQAVCRCAVVVGCGEALQMQTPRATCRQNNRVGVHGYQLAFFQVIQHRAHAVALVIRQQFHGRMAVELLNARLNFNGFTQHFHHFQAGEIAVAQDALRGGAACFFAHQLAISIAALGVKIHAQANQPANRRGRIGNHLGDQFFFARHVAAFDGVFIMALQAVVIAHGSLNAALRHHGVAVADAQLVRHNHAYALGCGG